MPRRAAIAMHAVMLLVSLAVLLFELGLTRVLSVTMWYHFAFLTMSLALLGMSVAATAVFLRGRPLAARAPAVVPELCALFALALLVVPAVYLGLDLKVTFTWVGVLRLVLALLLFLVPYTLGGAVVALLLAAWPRRVATLYFADLLGAGLGCALAVPLLERVPAPVLLALCAVLPAAAALVAAAVAPRPRRRGALLAGVALAGVALAAATAGAPRSPYRVRHAKTYDERGVIAERWNALARLTVYRDVFWLPDPTHPFGWGLSPRFAASAAEQLWIEQDASAGTPVARVRGPVTLREYPHLHADLTNLAYHVRGRPAGSVCVIGAGGGRDLLSAHAFGAARVTAVELNPAMVDLVQGELGAFSGRPYALPGVTPVIDEGRSFLSRSRARYDVLQLSLTDSWAASVAGAYALAESSLYTREAFRLYLERLTDDGVLTISRWYKGLLGHETVRTVALALQALEDLGVAEPRRHLAVAHAPDWTATVLVRRTPFPEGEIARLRAATTLGGFPLLWAPDDPAPSGAGDGGNPVRLLVASPDWRRTLDLSPFDLSPPGDDRPFFFQVQRRPLGWLAPAATGALPQNIESTAVLTLLLVLVSLLGVGLVLVPLWLWQRRQGPLPLPGPARRRALVYFLALGLGFMLVEVALVQRTILFLGHPLYATAVVLCTLLCAGGLGSALAGRVAAAPWRRGAHLAALGALVAVVVAQAVLGPRLFAQWQELARPARIALAVAVLAPQGLLMGLQLPLGLRRVLDEGGEALVPWLWSVNGVASVLASVGAMVLAIWRGYGFCLGVGAACYAACLWLAAARPGVRAAG
ncbi:MAG TPA: hypothetical protein VGQ83_20915 [Polyangia bacterium]|jgi:hypothetical protein